MKTCCKHAVVVLLLLKSIFANAGAVIEHDENEKRSKIISIPKRIETEIGSPKRIQSASLYNQAFQLLGETPFSRKLKEEELKEERLRLELQQRSRISASHVLYPSLCIPIMIAVTKYGFATTFQETAKKSANILMFAWFANTLLLPVLLFNPNWIEVLSVALLLVRPHIWSFLVSDFFSDTWSIVKKLLVSELWRQFWKHTTRIVAMPILSPPTPYLELTPDWFQKGWIHANKVVDKYVHGLFRRFFEWSFQESLGIIVGATFENLSKRRHMKDR